jgi:hypothetical protein
MIHNETHDVHQDKRARAMRHALVFSVLVNVALALTCVVLQKRSETWHQMVLQQQSLLQQQQQLLIQQQMSTDK